MGPLAWIGRQRTRAVAALVPIGVLPPPLGAALKPYVTEAVVGILCIAFLRIDITAFRTHLRRPWLVILATAWTLLAVPVVVALTSLPFGVERAVPDLYTGLMLQAIASPMMAAPALAALMGLDATLALATLILSTALTPLSAPLFAAVLSLDLSLSPLDLGIKLAAVLAGSAAVGLVLRRIMGANRIARYRDEIDGVNIVILFVFVAAVMGDVGTAFLARPLLVCGLLVLAFAVFALLATLSHVVFLACGARRAFTVAMTTAQKNMGLMLAGTGGVVPDLTWLYFALGQFPIYLAPAMLRPLAAIIDRQGNAQP